MDWGVGANRRSLFSSRETAHVAQKKEAATHASDSKKCRSGSVAQLLKPRVLVYPALVLHGADNMLLTLLEESEESLLEYSKDRTTDEHSLGPHVDKLATGVNGSASRP